LKIIIFLLVTLFCGFAYTEVSTIQASAKFLSKNNQTATVRFGKNIIKVPMNRIENYSRAKTGTNVQVVLFPEELGFALRSPASFKKMKKFKFKNYK